MNYKTLKSLNDNIQDCIDHILDTHVIQTKQAAYYFWLLVLTLVSLLDAKDNNRLTVNRFYSDNINKLPLTYSLRNRIAHADKPVVLSRDLKLYATNNGYEVEKFIQSHGYGIQLTQLISQSISVL